MALADDINKLRQSGRDESKILEAVKAFAPQHSKDIDTLLQRGAAPNKILDAVSAHDAQTTADSQSGLFENTKGAMLQSLASPLQGVGESARQAGLTTAGDILKNAGDALVPDNYKTGQSTVMDSNESLGTRLKAAPQAMVEGAGGLATDLAAARLGAMGLGAAGSVFGPVGAGVGGVIGAGLGFGGSYVARNWGNTAQESADARTGQKNSEVTTSDKQKALATTAAEAALSRVGLNSALGGAVKGSVKELIPQIAGKVGKAAVVDAGTSGASDILHQGVIDPSNLTADHVLASSLLGGATGAVLRTGMGAHEVGSEKAKAKTFADLDPENGANLAKRFEGKDFETTKQAFDSVTSVENSLKSELSERQSAMGKKLTSLQERSGFKDDTHELVADAATKLTKGETLDQPTLTKLKDRLGDHHEDSAWLDTVNDYNSLNKLKKVGSYDKSNGGSFGGGITGSKAGAAVLNPFGAINKYIVGPAEIAHVGLGAAMPGAKIAAFDPTLGLGYLAAQYGLRKGASAIDSFRGVDNPTQHFMDRFGNTEAPTSDTMSKPSFRQEQVEQKAREAAAAEAEKVQASSEKQATKEQTASEKQAKKEADEKAAAEDKRVKEAAKAATDAAKAKARLDAKNERLQAAKDAKDQRLAEAQKKQQSPVDGLTKKDLSNWKEKWSTLTGFARLRQASEAAGERLSAKSEREQEAQAKSMSPVVEGMTNADLVSWRKKFGSIQNVENLKNQELGKQERAAKAEETAKATEQRKASAEDTAVVRKVAASYRIRRNTEALAESTKTKEEAAKTKASDAAIANSGRIWKLRKNSESSSVSDATLALKVAKLKQKYENDRNKFAAQESRIQERQAKTEAKETARQEAASKKDVERKEKQAQREDALKAKADSKNAKSEKAPKDESKAEPKAEKADTNLGDMIHVKVGNQTVSKSKDTIRNESAWKASVHKSMTIRHNVTESVKKIVGKEHHKDATEMLTRFNNAEGTSRHEAYMAAENFVNKLPEALQGKVFDAIDKPELWSTFKDK